MRKEYYINRGAYKKLKNYVRFLYGLQIVITISATVRLYDDGYRNISVYLITILPIIIPICAVYIAYTIFKKRLKQNRIVLSEDRMKIDTYHKLKHEKNSIIISELTSIKCVDKYSPFYKVYSFDCIDRNMIMSVEAYGENSEFIVDLLRTIKRYPKIEMDKYFSLLAKKHNL